MNELQKAKTHRVFPVCRMGDTLILTPSGSLAGYGHGEAQREVRRVLKLLAGPGVENLVIDLRAVDYFGSEMIGIFVRLAQACRGATALVAVSSGMQKVLEVLRVEESFSVYRTRRTALKAVARIPLRERLASQFTGKHMAARLAAAAALLLALVWAGWETKAVYRVTGSSVARDYCKLNELWQEYHESAGARWTYEEDPAARVALERTLEQMEWKTSLPTTIFGPSEAERENLIAAAETFRMIVEQGPEEDAELKFLHYMHCTRNSIARRTGLDVPRPPSPRSTDRA